MDTCGKLCGMCGEERGKLKVKAVSVTFKKSLEQPRESCLEENWLGKEESKKRAQMEKEGRPGGNAFEQEKGEMWRFFPRPSPPTQRDS